MEKSMDYDDNDDFDDNNRDDGHLGFGSLLVVPEIRHMCAKFFFFHLHALAVDVEVSLQRIAALLEVLYLILCNHAVEIC